MEYRKRNLSNSWDNELPLSLDDRLEKASKNICVCFCKLVVSALQGFTNLTRSILGWQHVTDNKTS